MNVPQFIHSIPKNIWVVALAVTWIIALSVFISRPIYKLSW